MMQPDSAAPPLVLVVEDEAMIAMLLDDTIQEAGMRVLGPFANVSTALAAVEAQAAALSAAVLDVSLQGEMVWPVAAALAAAGVPCLLASGYTALPDGLAAPPFALLRKPYDPAELVLALRAACNSRGVVTSPLPSGAAPAAEENGHP